MIKKLAIVLSIVKVKMLPPHFHMQEDPANIDNFGVQGSTTPSMSKFGLNSRIARNVMRVHFGLL